MDDAAFDKLIADFKARSKQREPEGDQSAANLALVEWLREAIVDRVNVDELSVADYGNVLESLAVLDTARARVFRQADKALDAYLDSRADAGGANPEPKGLT